MEHETYERHSPWIRGLWMLVFAFLFEVAKFVLVVCAVVQFGWLLFTREKNPHIAAFGTQLGDWLVKTARFQTAASDQKPFPWAPWKE